MAVRQGVPVANIIRQGIHMVLHDLSEESLERSMYHKRPFLIQFQEKPIIASFKGVKCVIKGVIIKFDIDTFMIHIN